MEIRQLKRFITVAKTQNFTKAAELLHVAQPSLSKQILQLEEELGFSLFLRDTRPIQLTEAGQRLFEDAVSVVARLDQMKFNAQQIALGTKKTLTIGFVASALYAALPTVIRRLRRVRPDLEVKWLEMSSGEQVAALAEGRIDLGFGRIYTDSNEICRTVLREERLLAAFPPSFALASVPDDISLTELGDLPIIVYPAHIHPSFADKVLELLRLHSSSPSIIHTVGDLQTALGLASAESGYCVIPASSRHLRSDLVYRIISEPEAVSPLIMSYRLEDNESIVETIKQLTRELYAERPDWLEAKYNRIFDF
ncbi:LysR family transcriptional regulator [Pseudomonas moorei]|uniref:DNA-binding transcriptional regulator, LysR family n=1 Tax=Pseudomonas moorei TaxID=395599 RepID=A0A1H1ICS1_9PSED|nr:LysR family transcriptional regulator [Pseudomonas moorei]KAB0508997.1 LysR family transcriptional regulator [Pseudomonas moorei]SDR35460.1 DNA-binding transcriptional regulator, LysR family [Pseudomonas moorei]